MRIAVPKNWFLRDLIYFVEAIDAHGRGRLYPDLEKEAPYVIVAIIRDGA